MSLSVVKIVSHTNMCKFAILLLSFLFVCWWCVSFVCRLLLLHFIIVIFVCLFVCFICVSSSSSCLSFFFFGGGGWVVGGRGVGEMERIVRLQETDLREGVYFEGRL